MKQLTNLSKTYKIVIAFLMMTFLKFSAFAQDSTGAATKNSTSSTNSTTTTTTETWYTQPWVWIIGGAVLLLIIVALVRGNNNTTDVRTTKVIKERDTIV